MENRLMTAEQASELLGVSSRTLRRWRKQYSLPAYPLGRRVYFFKEEVVNFLKEQNTKLNSGGIYE